MQIQAKSSIWKIFTTDQIVFLMLTMTGFASAPLTLLSYRGNIAEISLYISADVEISAGVTWLSRLLNVVFLMLSLLLARNCLSDLRSIPIHSRNMSIAIGAYFILNYGLSSVLGLYPGTPDLYLILSIPVLMLLPLAPDVSSKSLIRVFRFVATVMVVGSLLMGIITPDTSFLLDSSYSFSDEGTKRLVGFFGHPTYLGLYAIMLLAIELYAESSGWLRIVNIVLSIVVLLLSISKTSIVIGLVFVAWSFVKKVKFGAVILTTALTLGAGFYLLSVDSMSFLSNEEGLYILTGRTGLWSTILELWTESIFFGNGPAFFSSQHDFQFVHAHNLILQSISDGGLFGLIGLSIYIYAFVRLAKHVSSVKSSLPISLVALLLAFSMSDAVTRIDNFYNGLFFINAFIMLYLCALERESVLH